MRKWVFGSYMVSIVLFSPAMLGEDLAALPPLPVTASSTNAEGFLPEFVCDGVSETRWASGTGTGDQWLQIDFAKPIHFQRISITWEAAYAVEYEVQVSDNGADWRTISSRSNGKGGKEDLTDLLGYGRWIRLLCHRQTTFPLYSIWEIAFPEPEAAAALSEVRARIASIHRETTGAARRHLREALSGRAGEVVFATRPMYTDGHWYANISYYAQDASLATYAKGGGLYKYDIGSGEVTAFVEDPEGTIRDPAVSHDGKTILFAWRKGGTPSFHLYTIDADTRGLTQLTFGEYDDIEPAWLPDGGIVFVSSRCRRWVNCWLTQVAVVHRCDADGKHIIPLSANLEQDNTPWPMPDGRILYTRWEYVDRSQVDYHHLWVMNPDGTAQQVYFGNMHPGGVFIDAKSVPDTEDVVFINSPGHGIQEHTGRVALLNCKRGPDDLASIRNISGDGFRDPCPVTHNVFMAAQGKRIVLLDTNGVVETLFSLPDTSPLLIHEPRPLCTQACERVIPRRVDYAKETGRLFLADVYAGRHMQDVARGDIKTLLVLESLPKPINYTGGMDPLTYGGSFSLERVLGTVPVEEDGSAYMELPAGRSLFFVALDAHGDSVKRMQSFCSVMPGETTSCLGCHEARTTSGLNTQRPKALAHPPRMATPVPGIPSVLDFPRDIQPILDQHCIRCHDYDGHPGASDGPRAGGVILSGDHGPMFSHSYVTLTVRRQFADGRDRPESNLPPRSIGSGASPLMWKIRGGHHQVSLSAREIDTIRLWIETGAPYPGTYAALGSGCIGGYYANAIMESDAEWPESKAAAEVIDRRCAGCHAQERTLPRYLSDEAGLSFWRPDWSDPRLLRSRHLVFNLSRPEKSLIVLAPLAPSAGGLGLCQIQAQTGTPGSDRPIPVFDTAADPDYQRLLAMCVAGNKRLETIKRFDMPGFLPPLPYIREMKRYGVIAADHPPDAPLNGYETDRAYWRSFEQSVALAHPAYSCDETGNERQ